MCTIYFLMSIRKQLNEGHDYFWKSSVDSYFITSTTTTRSSSELQDKAIVKLHNNDNDNKKTRYQYQNMLFIHVGKSGGTTLQGVLRVHCEEMLARKNKSEGRFCLSQLEPESRLSQVVKFSVHCRSAARKGHKAGSFLFILRHPVDRAISWYNVVNPANCEPGNNVSGPNCKVRTEITANPYGQASKFFTCFPQIEDWVLALRQDSNVSRCSELAWKMVKGDMRKRDRFSGHMYYNARMYASQTTLLYPEKLVFVIRTEQLWKDTIDLDLSLGGNGTFGEKEGSKYTHGSEALKTSRKSPLLVEDIKSLCCGLIDEMDIYRELVLRAVNLGKVSAQETWQGAIQKCGAYSWMELKAECAREKPVRQKVHKRSLSQLHRIKNMNHLM
jgi:hypothetical protein